MPDVDAADGARRRERLLPALFWCGIALTPLAGLLVLIGSSFTLRLGGFLGLTGVVLMALSLSLRPDPQTVRLQIEEILVYEVDQVRAELYDELARVARESGDGQRLAALHEQVGALAQAVDAVRAEQAALTTGPAMAPGQAVGAGQAVPAGPPVATGTAHGAASVASAPVATSAPAGVPAASAAAPVPAQAPPPPPSAPPGMAAAPPGAAPGPAGAEPPEAVGRAGSAGGVYRHTETVVTTRSTYVDEHPRAAAEPGWPQPDDGRSGDPGWAGPEHSWTGADGSASPERWSYPQQPRQPPDPPVPWQRPATELPPPAEQEPGWGRGGAGPPVPQQRGGERWASVRDDAYGSELQFGERRTARHRDEAGTELRYEDRWGAVRQSGPGAHAAGPQAGDRQPVDRYPVEQHPVDRYPAERHPAGWSGGGWPAGGWSGGEWSAPEPSAPERSAGQWPAAEWSGAHRSTPDWGYQGRRHRADPDPDDDGYGRRRFDAGGPQGRWR